MSDIEAPRCTVHYGEERCPNSTTGALPICGSCLARLLEESDPRRRRTLATLEHLPIGVVQQLLEDPDPQVRAQIATRNDLDVGAIARLADPNRESSPYVSRALASTPAGAEYAWELCSTNDPMTLAILAFNPAVAPDVLDALLDNPDPDVVQAATDARAGNPPSPRIAAEIADARVTEGRPISQAPVDEPTVVEPLGTQVFPSVPEFEVTPEPRRAMWIALSVLALVVVGALGFLVVNRTSSNRTLTGIGSGVDTTTTTTTVAKSTTTKPRSTTTTATTTPPTTAPPATAAPTAPPATQPAITAGPNPANGPLSSSYTIVPAAGKACYQVKITPVVSPMPMQVVIVDSLGNTIFSGPVTSSDQTIVHDYPPGQSITSVTITGTVVASSIYVGGSIQGSTCPVN